MTNAKPSLATSIIETWESETGSLFDDPNSPALAGITGTVARLMGVTNHGESEDFAVGLLIIDKSLDNQAKVRERELDLFLKSLGVSFDD